MEVLFFKNSTLVLTSQYTKNAFKTVFKQNSTVKLNSFPFWLTVCLHMFIQYPKIQDCSILLSTFVTSQYTQNALKQIFSKTLFLKVEQP